MYFILYIKKYIKLRRHPQASSDCQSGLRHKKSYTSILWSHNSWFGILSLLLNSSINLGKYCYDSVLWCPYL